MYRHVCTCLYTCLFTCLDTCPDTCLHASLCTRGTCLRTFSGHNSVHKSVHMSIHMFVHTRRVSAHMSVDTLVQMSIHMSIHMSICACPTGPFHLESDRERHKGGARAVVALNHGHNVAYCHPDTVTVPLRSNCPYTPPTIHVTCASVQMHAYAHVCIYTYTHVCMYICTHVCTYIYRHVCMHAQTCLVPWQVFGRLSARRSRPAMPSTSMHTVLRLSTDRT